MNLDEIISVDDLAVPHSEESSFFRTGLYNFDVLRSSAQSNAKIADMYGGPDKVLIGNLHDLMADVAHNRIMAKIEAPIYNESFVGLRRLECHIDCDSKAELVAMYRHVYDAAQVVVDIATGVMRCTKG